MVTSNLKRFLLLTMVPLAAALGADADPVDIVRRSLRVENENAKRARNYTFLQREEQRHLDGNGQVKSKSAKTWDVTLLVSSDRLSFLLPNCLEIVDRISTSDTFRLATTRPRR